MIRIYFTAVGILWGSEETAQGKSITWHQAEFCSKADRLGVKDVEVWSMRVYSSKCAQVSTYCMIPHVEPSTFARTAQQLNSDVHQIARL